MQFETIERRPITEMSLPNSKTRSVLGKKGFQKSSDPKTAQIKIHITPQVKSFLDQYCEINNISISRLMLACLECYTGFNGSNHEDIIHEAKMSAEMKSYIDTPQP
jgi:hypothetical protein